MQIEEGIDILYEPVLEYSGGKKNLVTTLHATIIRYRTRDLQPGNHK